MADTVTRKFLPDLVTAVTVALDRVVTFAGADAGLPAGDATGAPAAGSSIASYPSEPAGVDDDNSSAARSTALAATVSEPSNMLSDVAVALARYASVLEVVASTPESTADVASLRSRSATWAGVNDREFARIAAATPATCGAAMDVPLSVAVAVAEEIPADTMDEPGAKRSTHAP